MSPRERIVVGVALRGHPQFVEQLATPQFVERLATPQVVKQLATPQFVEQVFSRGAFFISTAESLPAVTHNETGEEKP